MYAWSHHFTSTIATTGHILPGAKIRKDGQACQAKPVIHAPFRQLRTLGGAALKCWHFLLSGGARKLPGISH